MTKGHNQDDQKKPNDKHQGAQNVSKRDQENFGSNEGRKSDPKQSVKKSGDEKGKNAIK